MLLRNSWAANDTENIQLSINTRSSEVHRRPTIHIVCRHLDRPQRNGALSRGNQKYIGNYPLTTSRINGKLSL